MQKHRSTARVLLSVCLVLAAHTGFAQNDLHVRPILRVSNVEQPVELSSAEVSVTTTANEAWTRYDLVFRNPNPRVLEGSLDFPLADGQQVVGFALDINGELRDAVAVPKARGRAVFEAVERRGVDPALLEKTAGNHYSLRVYPIPAGGTRKVRLWVAQALKREGDRYRMPVSLGFARGVQDIPLSVEGGERVTLSNVARRMNWSGPEKRTWTTLDARDLDGAGQITLEWPASTAPVVLLQRAPQGDFALVDLALPEAAATDTRIRHLALIWDASLSGLDRDHDLEILALDRLLKKLGNVRVSLQVLRNASDPIRTFDVRGGDGSALQTVLRALPYDGATRASAIRPVTGADRYLYVGDGLFNLGVDEVPTLPARLDAWINGSADTPRLRSWTARHNGLVFALDNAASLPRVDGMLSSPALVERIDVPGGRAAVLESPFVDADGRVRFAVERQSADAVATVHWRDARGSHASIVPLNGDVVEGRMAAYTWARWTMDALEAGRATHRSELQRLGSRFGIPNAESSLIVLESLDDYVTFDIAPPASLLDAWTRARRQQDIGKREKEKAQLEGLVARYAERGEWWSKTFPKNTPTGFKPEPVVADAPAPAAMMSPPVPTPAPTEASVTATAAPAARARAERSNAADAGALARSASTGAGRAATIQIQPWLSDSPEAKRLRAVAKADLYSTYLDARGSHRESPPFYMDAADVMRQRGETKLALRVLTNLAELDIEDRHLLRLLAYRLEELKAWKEAVPLLRRVLELAPDEPQSHRDLAIALQHTGQYQAAADAFYTVATGRWDPRFADIDLISVVELNALINSQRGKIRTDRFDRRLLAHYPVGLRTVLSWDADNSDMDLWVTDPNGERVYYGHTASYQGGRISDDFTGGYGPEEFVLRDPKKGTYKVEANYFGDRRQALAGETTLMLTFSTGYGTPNQHDETVTLRLKDKRETIAVGEFLVK